MQPTSHDRIFTFGEFVLHPDAGELYRRGHRLKAGPQQITLLTILAENEGKRIAKEIIEHRLWPEGRPTKNRLNVLVSSVWSLLGDTNRSRRKYIASLGREGYCFIHPVSGNRVIINDQKAEEYFRAGKHYLDKRQESGLRDSTLLFKKALDCDPSHALAWVGLADANIMMAIHCMVAPEEAFSRARSAALEALKVQPNLPEALTSIGWVRLCYERDWQAASSAFDSALKAIPDYYFAYNGQALLEIAMGRIAESVSSMQTAHTYHAISVPLDALLCHTLYLARRFTESVETGMRVVEFSPTSSIAHASLALGLLQLGRFSEALLHFDTARIHSNDSRVYLGFWGYACALLGKRLQAESVLRRLIDLPSHQYVPSYFAGLIHLGLDDRQQSLEWLARACDERSHWTLFLNADPMFDGLRDDGQFKALVRKSGIEDTNTRQSGTGLLAR